VGALEKKMPTGDTVRREAATGFHSLQDCSAARCDGPMTNDNDAELRAQLARLQQEHRDLDVAIAALEQSPGSDILQVQRLKKRKLWLRDRITFLEDQITPDIIA
jgi:hypothetical protein